MLLVKSVLALISALALASGQQFAEWMTQDFDDLDVCLYNGNLRTKKIVSQTLTIRLNDLDCFLNNHVLRVICRGKCQAR